MPVKFPRLKAGDILSAKIINDIHAELNRWRGLSASGLIDVDYADSGNISPQIVDNRTSTALIPAQLTTTLASGSIASPTTGTMTLLVGTGTVGALTTTGGTTGVDVYNTLGFSSTLASGTHIWVASFGGLYYLVQSSCS